METKFSFTKRMNIDYNWPLIEEKIARFFEKINRICHQRKVKLASTIDCVHLICLLILLHCAVLPLEFEMKSKPKNPIQNYSSC